MIHFRMPRSEAIKNGMNKAREAGKQIGRPLGGEREDQFIRKPKSQEILELLKTGLGVRASAREMGSSVNTVRKVKAWLDKQPKIAKMELWLRVERNSRWVRGKKRSREDIEIYVLGHLNKFRKVSDHEYEFELEYEDVKDLEEQAFSLWSEMNWQADMRNCFVEGDLQCKELGLSW